MYSSKPTTHSVLANRANPVGSQRFLVELLNLRHTDPKACERFASRFFDWLPNFRDVYLDEGLRMLEDSSPDRLARIVRETIAGREFRVMYPTCEEQVYEVLHVGKRLKDIWGLPTSFVREVAILDLLASRLNHHVREWWSLKTPPTGPPANVFEQLNRELPVRLFGSEVQPDLSNPSLGRFEIALCYCLHSVDRLRVCQNHECNAPYFFAKRRSQKYCSDICALPAQREFKRRWWAEHGEAQRRSRKASVKKPHRKGGK